MPQAQTTTVKQTTSLTINKIKGLVDTYRISGINLEVMDKAMHIDNANNVLLNDKNQVVYTIVTTNKVSTISRDGLAINADDVTEDGYLVVIAENEYCIPRAIDCVNQIYTKMQEAVKEYDKSANQIEEV